MDQGNAPTEDSDPIQRLCANLRVIKRQVKSHELTQSRNRHALQAALIRGDKNVLLDGTSRITSDLTKGIRVPFTINDKYGHPQFVKWLAYHKPHRAGDTNYPDYLREILQADPSCVWDGFELAFLKVVGSGGYGLATLWEVTFEDDSRLKVVMKSNQESDGPFEPSMEAAWHNRYRNAAHTVQIVDLAARVVKVRAALTQANLPWKIRGNERVTFVPELQQVMVLEYAEHGSLYHCAARIHNNIPKIPDKQLWQLWECLVKGLASTSYTPTFIKASHELVLDSRMDEAEREDFDALLSEAENSLNSKPFFHNLRRREETHDVHFDLDEQNILVFDDTSFGHEYNPFLKFNDFGMSQQMRRQWSKSEGFFWALRNPPKIDRAAPEQFHQDWDNVKLGEEYSSNFRSPDLKHGYRIAGRYGSWTNVFLVGQIMEGLITGIRKTHPMTAKELESDDYANIDEQLRQTVMRCLSVAPIDRPNIVDLLEEVVRRKHEGFEEPDDDTGAFWQHILHEAPPGISLSSSPKSLPSRKYKPPRRPRPLLNNSSTQNHPIRGAVHPSKIVSPRRQQGDVQVGSAVNRNPAEAAKAAAAMYPNVFHSDDEAPIGSCFTQLRLMAEAGISQLTSRSPAQDRRSPREENGIPSQPRENDSFVDATSGISSSVGSTRESTVARAVKQSGAGQGSWSATGSSGNNTTRWIDHHADQLYSDRHSNSPSSPGFFNPCREQSQVAAATIVGRHPFRGTHAQAPAPSRRCHDSCAPGSRWGTKR
ncbi:hypothetical protein HJFPF1_01339 [Paramyrothecium foliicola]|nr:hypothetical protein HJFPF1_01339 [Paramyrothecium foliicola]